MRNTVGREQATGTTVADQALPAFRPAVSAAEAEANLVAALAAARARLASDQVLWSRMQEISTRLLPGGDLGLLLGELLDVAVSVTGVDGGCLYLAHCNSPALQVVAVRGLARTSVELLESFGPPGSPLLPTHTRIVIADLTIGNGGEPDLMTATLERSGLRGYQATPLVSRSGLLLGGLMTLANRPHAPDDRDLRMLDLLARQAADFIDRCRADEEAARVRTGLRAIIDGVSEAIVTFDDRWNILTANQAAGRMFGYRPEDLVGLPIAMLMDEAERQRYGLLFSGSLGAACGLIGRGLDLPMARRDGLPLQVEMVITELEPGHTYTGVMRDISARLANEARSRQADRLAAMGTLAAGLGHDMNNMLLPIRAHLNALKAGAKAHGATECDSHIDEIGQAVRYLQQLADGLHFLVTDSGHADGGAEGANLADWWASTGALLRRSLPPLAQVDVDIPEGLPSVRLSTHALTQAMLNLFVNAGEAITARGDGTVARVRVSAHVEPDGRTVALSVTDNGTGMSEAVRRRALDMFFTTKSRSLGTGLGLSLVNRVASEAGGSVSIESAEGVGTSVILNLPFAMVDDGQCALHVAVSLGDARAAAFMRSAMESRGFAGVDLDDPSKADAWVVDPRVVRAEEAFAWKARVPGRAVVLWGRPHRLQAAAWRGIAEGSVPRANDFDALLAGVDQACSIILRRVQT